MSDVITLTKMARRYQERRDARSDGGERVYESVARRLMQAMREGQYGIGDRLPAERDLASQFAVSRSAVREALLALEVFGVIEVRLSSGAYVVNIGDQEWQSSISPLELTEARLMIECEAAALAASRISPEEIAALEKFVDLIGSVDPELDPDEAFHRLIGRATRNKVIERTVSHLWDLRASMPDCAVLLEKGRMGTGQAVIDEHRAIIAALRSGDGEAARAAMRAHLEEVIDLIVRAQAEIGSPLPAAHD